MKPRTQYALALLLAFTWGIWRGWAWTDYATAAITIRVLLALAGLFKPGKTGGTATVGAVGAPNQAHQTILESGSQEPAA
jgi:hypothetical protein